MSMPEQSLLGTVIPPLRVGDSLVGFCGGAFGRDSYGEKRVEALGADWIVARDLESGDVELARCQPDSLCEYRR